MKLIGLLLILAPIIWAQTLLEEGTNANEQDAVRFLQVYDAEASFVCNRVLEASWNFQTNATDFNKNIMLAEQLAGARFNKRAWSDAVKFRWRDFSDDTLKRMFSFVTNIGIAALPEDERAQYASLLQNMKTRFSRAKVCRYTPNAILERNRDREARRKEEINSDTNRRLVNKNDVSTFEGDRRFLEDDVSDVDILARRIGPVDKRYDETLSCPHVLRLDPDVIQLMRTSRNPEELEFLWIEWRKQAGQPLRESFRELVETSNRAAQFNGFNNTAEMWLQEYESATFEEDIDEIWQQIKPLYEQLHTYVRRKLITRYTYRYFWNDRTIPAHLLGDMWGQNWINIMDLTVPFPGSNPQDISEQMRLRGFTPLSMYQAAEQFFLSLGFPNLPVTFWERSLFQRPPDRQVLCEPSSWDFCNGRDYRVKHCAQITSEDFETAHHELGHIEYSIAYRNNPFIFRDGASPGFHEAIGDAIALSATSTSQLQAIRLLERQDNSYERDINLLFKMALEKVAFLPFAYVVDKWRWMVFREEITQWEYNQRWWDMRVKYQGITPPIYTVRSEDHFDPGAKYHIAAHIPYIRYFVGTILTFQIHEELCNLAGQNDRPLHQCNIFGSAEAGLVLRNVLSLGKSRSWKEVLSILTNGRTDKLDARPLLRYFTPLEDWLISQNNNEYIGWSATSLVYSPFVRTASAGFVAIVIALLALVILVIVVIAYMVRRAKKERFKSSAEIPQ